MNQQREIRARGLLPELKIRPYDENEDAPEFLATFERTMNLHHVGEHDWVHHLVCMLITGKAKTAYNEVDASAEFAVVKQAILDQLEATPDVS